MRSLVACGLLLGLCSFLHPRVAFAEPVAPAIAPSSRDDAPASGEAAQPPPSGDTLPALSAPPPPGSFKPLERTANNAIYIEGLGAGLLYSLNYERDFGDFGARLGFSYLSVGVSENTNMGRATSSASLLTVPITVSYLGIGSKMHMFEVGAGATIVHAGAGASAFDVDSSKTASGSTTLLFGDVLAGYRFQPPGGGFLLRVGMSGVIGGGTLPVFPWPYLGLGGAF